LNRADHRRVYSHIDARRLHHNRTSCRCTSLEMGRSASRQVLSSIRAACLYLSNDERRQNFHMGRRPSERTSSRYSVDNHERHWEHGIIDDDLPRWRQSHARLSRPNRHRPRRSYHRDQAHGRHHRHVADLSVCGNLWYAPVMLVGERAR
jgi:hypothetical protein